MRRSTILRKGDTVQLTERMLKGVFSRRVLHLKSAKGKIVRVRKDGLIEVLFGKDYYTVDIGSIKKTHTKKIG